MNSKRGPINEITLFRGQGSPEDRFVKPEAGDASPHAPYAPAFCLGPSNILPSKNTSWQVVNHKG